VLPGRVRGKLLWSPANTGPVVRRNQVVTIHDIAPLDHPEWMSPRFAAWYGWLTPRLAHQCRAIITDSLFTKSRLIERLGVSEEKINAIAIGVDSAFRPASEEDISTMRRAYRLPEGNYLLSLSTLEPRKNLARLLAAWAQLREDRNIAENFSLVLAGEEGDNRIFRGTGLATIPSGVHFTGRVEDQFLPALYSGATAFAYPSIYEGFGLPLLEAMACGTPVLCGNRASLPEVIGDAGLLVDPYDVDAITEGLRTLLLDDALRDRFRHEGFERANAYSWEACASKTLAVLTAAAKA